MIAKVTNVKAEVVGPSFPIGSQPRVGSLKAEVVGASFAQKFESARVSALKAEVVISAIRRSKGFDLPSINVGEFVLFVVFQPRNWETGTDVKHMSLLHVDPQHGIFLRRSGVNIELYMRYGETGEASAICTVPSFNTGMIATIGFKPDTKEAIFRINGQGSIDPVVVNGDWSNFIFKSLGGYLQQNESQDHSIAEVILYNQALSGTTIEAIEQFLNCRWLGPGPNEENNFCIPL